ncbi:MAG: amidohydrolase family protein [Candidatus Rokubacteria bacterium]|nr:amidohydrolase family protein [Candidatus Rokubacteria bacterium]
MFDVLIRGGTVVDGTGAPARPADVAVEGGRVVAVEPRLAAEGRRTLEADGLLVAPGFIDIHTHSDFFLLQVPSAESKLRQGVTTEVIGMCGFSPAPAVPERLALLQDHVAFLAPRLPWDWRGFGEWCARLRGAGLSVNVVPFVGHGAIRIAAMGFERRPPTPEELRTMEALVARAMDEGAFGPPPHPPSAFCAPNSQRRPRRRQESASSDPQRRSRSGRPRDARSRSPISRPRGGRTGRRWRRPSAPSTPPGPGGSR